MDKNKDQRKQVSSCFDGQACAEMMQKILGKKGIGSLSQEKMRSVMRWCCEAKEGPHEAHGEKEAKDDKSRAESQTTRDEDNDRRTGGVK